MVTPLLIGALSAFCLCTGLTGLCTVLGWYTPAKFFADLMMIIFSACVVVGGLALAVAIFT